MEFRTKLASFDSTTLSKAFSELESQGEVVTQIHMTGDNYNEIYNSKPDFLKLDNDESRVWTARIYVNYDIEKDEIILYSGDSSYVQDEKEILGNDKNEFENVAIANYYNTSNSEQLEYKIDLLTTKHDEVLNVLANMQIMINGIVTASNMQSYAINTVNQQLQSFNAKMSDIEVNLTGTQDSFDEIKDAQQNLVTVIEEVKAKIDNIKIFYYPEN